MELKEYINNRIKFHKNIEKKGGFASIYSLIALTELEVIYALINSDK